MLALPAIAALVLSVPALADEPPAAGKLLVADRQVTDPHFGKTVILLLAYGEQGAKGLIVNRRTEVAPAEILPDVKGLKRYKQPVFVGGPVERDQFLLLARLDDPPDGMVRILADVCLGQTRETLERLAAARRTRERFRLYSGYAGWAPGQLDAEIARGDWHVSTADPDAVFSDDPAGLWRRLVPERPQRRVDLGRRRSGGAADAS